MDFCIQMQILFRGQIKGPPNLIIAIIIFLKYIYWPLDSCSEQKSRDVCMNPGRLTIIHSLSASGLISLNLFICRWCMHDISQIIHKNSKIKSYYIIFSHSKCQKYEILTWDISDFFDILFLFSISSRIIKRKVTFIVMQELICRQ